MDNKGLEVNPEPKVEVQPIEDSELHKGDTYQLQLTSFVLQRNN